MGETLVRNTVDGVTDHMYIIDNNRESNNQPRINQNASDDIPLLEKCALDAIEQGIWTVVSYSCDISSPGLGIWLANQFKPSIRSIHEFDMERFCDVFGSESNLYKAYQSLSFAPESRKTAELFVIGYLAWKPKYFNRGDEETIHMVGIMVGAAIALKELASKDPTLAAEIASIVSVPIGVDDLGALLLENTADIN